MGAAGETTLVDSANELTLSLPEERMMQVEDGLSPEGIRRLTSGLRPVLRMMRVVVGRSRIGT